MMILRALSLLIFIAIFSFTFSNQEMLLNHVKSLHMAADASDVIFQTAESDLSSIEKQKMPTFMQLQKINQHELPAQARIGYLLSRGF